MSETSQAISTAERLAAMTDTQITAFIAAFTAELAAAAAARDSGLARQYRLRINKAASELERRAAAPVNA